MSNVKLMIIHLVTVSIKKYIKWVITLNWTVVVKKKEKLD